MLTNYLSGCPLIVLFHVMLDSNKLALFRKQVDNVMKSFRNFLRVEQVSVYSSVQCWSIFLTAENALFRQPGSADQRRVRNALPALVD